MTTATRYRYEHRQGEASPIACCYAAAPYAREVDRLDGNLVEQDIAARRQEALIGYEFAKQVDRIEAALQSVKSNLDLDQWCKQTCGCDISTMRRRKRLFRHWREYEGKRRELGQCGQTGLLFALSLVKDDHSDITTYRQALPVRSDSGTDWGRSRAGTLQVHHRQRSDRAIQDA